jgi:hypothetical protein
MVSWLRADHISNKGRRIPDEFLANFVELRSGSVTLREKTRAVLDEEECVDVDTLVVVGDDLQPVRPLGTPVSFHTLSQPALMTRRGLVTEPP